MHAQRKTHTGGQRERDVDNETDIGNVKTTSSNIGCDEYVDLARLESVKGLEPRTLIQVTVQTSSQMAGALDRLLKTGCLLLVQSKNEDTGGVRSSRWVVLNVVAQVEQQSWVLLA